MIDVRKYGRHFAVYEGEWLLAVYLYQVGALAVKRRIEELEAQLAKTRDGQTGPTLVSETTTDASSSAAR